MKLGTADARSAAAAVGKGRIVETHARDTRLGRRRQVRDGRVGAVGCRALPAAHCVATVNQSTNTNTLRGSKTQDVKVADNGRTYRYPVFIIVILSSQVQLGPNVLHQPVLIFRLDNAGVKDSSCEWAEPPTPSYSPREE